MYNCQVHRRSSIGQINHFISKLEVVGIDNAALQILMEYNWPGNIRELQNVLERASILAGEIIMKENLPNLQSVKISKEFEYDLPERGFDLDDFEKFLILQALEKSDSNKTKAAQLLGITRRRLYSMMERFSISA